MVEHTLLSVPMRKDIERMITKVKNRNSSQQMMDVDIDGVTLRLESRVVHYREPPVDDDAECKFVVMVEDWKLSGDEWPESLENVSEELADLVEELSAEIDRNRSYQSELPFSFERYNESENVAYYTQPVIFKLSENK
jgi:hypothetical protein